MEIRLNHKIVEGKALYTIENAADGSIIEVRFPVTNEENAAIPHTRELQARAREILRTGMDEAEARARVGG